jgi:hypothetical protein
LIRDRSGKVNAQSFPHNATSRVLQRLNFIANTFDIVGHDRDCHLKLKMSALLLKDEIVKLRIPESLLN